MTRESEIRDALLASETGAFPVPADGGPLVALVFPDSYRVGMSSLGYQAAGALMAAGGARIERFFADLPGDTTLEGRRRLADADVIAFSVAYELDFLRMLEILERAGIPTLARERRATGGRRPPLVLAGGTAILVNRLPVYDLVDVFAHGAGEIIIPRLMRALAANPRGWSGDGRAALLESLGAIEGLEVTAGAQAAAGLVPLVSPEAAQAPRPAPPNVCSLADLDAWPLRSVILSERAEFAGKCLVELSRGCPHHCAFCWAGHNIRPYALRATESVMAILEQEAARTRSFGLIAAAVGAHPGIDEICAWCERREIALSFSSLRVEDVTESMLRALARSGQRSLTLAPETAAPRLRRLLVKRIEDEQVIALAERAVRLGLPDLKLYFMTGLPTETDEEAREIVPFIECLRRRFVDAARPLGRLGTISVNLGVYVPHPATPLARLEIPLPSPTDVERRLRDLTRALRRLPNVRVLAGSVDTARAQRILCAGDRRSLDFLRLARTVGDRWRPALRLYEDHG